MEQMYTEMASIKSQVLLHPDHQDNHCPSQFVQEREQEAVSQQQDQVPFGIKEGQTPTRKLKTTYKASYTCSCKSPCKVSKFHTF
ncbi:unnamed protein product [Brassica napus]|uniref:(rape) hypothetical protein n=1 Tax=Brassica napus TaxID=3708 RepID=A0A816KN67_BRANA|nr:unnamed protein product [Brassica napus]